MRCEAQTEQQHKGMGHMEGSMGGEDVYLERASHIIWHHVSICIWVFIEDLTLRYCYNSRGLIFGYVSITTSSISAVSKS